MACQKCVDLCASRTQVVLPDVPEFGRRCRLLVIGEAPGADEDAQGKGFVGRSGRTLHRLLEEQGLRRGFDYGCANIVRCRPPENRRPTIIEIARCLPFLAKTLSEAQPKVVLTVGETATRAITGIVGLSQNIRFLETFDFDPVVADMLVDPVIKSAWPDGTKLVPMPHTSPLAWNRKTPQGQPWSVIGQGQIRKVKEILNVSS